MKKLEDFPKFTVKNIQSKDTNFIISGTFNFIPLALDNRYWLIKKEECFIGDLCELDQENKTGAFIFYYKEEADQIRLHETYSCITSYWNWNFMAIILNNETLWEKGTFQAKDAQVFYLPNGLKGWMELGGKIPEDAKIGEVIKNGWDHEECEICVKRIGKGGESDFYKHKRFWLCVDCFNKYASNRDLSFVDRYTKH